MQVQLLNGDWDGNYGKLLLAECFRTTQDAERASATSDHVKRISAIVDRISWLLDTYKPNVVAAEFPTGGARGAGAIRGMSFATATAAAALRAYRAPLYILSPTANKKASTQDGHAEKEDVVAAVANHWDVAWPMMKKKKSVDQAACWAMADALSAVITFLKAKHAPGYLDGLGAFANSRSHSSITSGRMSYL